MAPARFCTLQFFSDVMRTHALLNLILLCPSPGSLYILCCVAVEIGIQEPSQTARPCGGRAMWQALSLPLDGHKEWVFKESHKQPNPTWASPIWVSLQFYEWTLKMNSHLWGWNLERNGILLWFSAKSSVKITQRLPRAFAQVCIREGSLSCGPRTFPEAEVPPRCQGMCLPLVIIGHEEMLEDFLAVQ